ncbi:hypothetical protein [Saccharospirillum sp. MSK14-1]|uniref:hypothetical protein n=1 Tax=Saccharospirillum sp. MSK14-1 TaxID=1897632 RepID=UPI0011B1DDF1|nr:hypothetical protein [Saccharospirillum sp. MSK14-1]
MKTTTLLATIILISGCTISARNHHFELQPNSASSYDSFSNIWCYTPEDIESVQVCSRPYRRTSKYIGIIIPIIPQLNRNSRLAYDVVRSRKVQFKNLSPSASVVLSDLNGIQLCSGQYSSECVTTGSLSVDSMSSVWLKIPAGETHPFTMHVGSSEHRVTLVEFTDSRWHLVSV